MTRRRRRRRSSVCKKEIFSLNTAGTKASARAGAAELPC
jgi:hypothetical protein